MIRGESNQSTNASSGPSEPLFVRAYFLRANATAKEKDRNNTMPVKRITVKAKLKSILMARAIDKPHPMSPIEISSTLTSASDYAIVLNRNHARLRVKANRAGVFRL